MESVPLQNLDLLRAVQALLVRQGPALEGSTLLALLGQDVEMLFQAATPEGAKLQLPSGQTVTAQGELPYPEGTQLRVRILPPPPGENGLRLQLQEARPPAPPAVLSPLFQSEAQSLAARLPQEPALAPLMRLLSLLADVPSMPASLPSSALVQSAIQDLPQPLQASLAQVLGAERSVGTQELAEMLRAWVHGPPVEAHIRALSPPPSVAPLQDLVRQVLARFSGMVSQLPRDHREVLMDWLRNLLQRAPEEARPEMVPAKTALPSPQVAQEPSIPPKLVAVLLAHKGPKAELPESWEAWIRGTVRTLADPLASPREAPFHALQAKEGTAFFEIPLPWPQAGPLQIWVESDAPEQRHGGHDTTQRVLLGLTFSNLGETRLGLAQGSFGLRIRVWTERPETLEAQRSRMEEDLKTLGKPVDLKFLALTYSPDGTVPSLRAMVTGPSISALG